MSLKSNYRDGDFFTKRSKKEGYRSRASYKLKELLQKEIRVSKGQSILDLGFKEIPTFLFCSLINLIVLETSGVASG